MAPTLRSSVDSYRHTLGGLTVKGIKSADVLARTSQDTGVFITQIHGVTELFPAWRRVVRSVDDTSGNFEWRSVWMVDHDSGIAVQHRDALLAGLELFDLTREEPTSDETRLQAESDAELGVDPGDRPLATQPVHQEDDPHR